MTLEGITTGENSLKKRTDHTTRGEDSWCLLLYLLYAVIVVAAESVGVLVAIHSRASEQVRIR